MSTFPVSHNEDYVEVEVDSSQLARAGIHSREQAQRVMDRISNNWMRTQITNGVTWDELSDDIMIDVGTSVYCYVTQATPEQVSIQAELGERVSALVYCESRSWDSINEAVDEISEKYDLPYGLALPAANNESCYTPVLASGTPLSHVQMGGTELAQRLRLRKMTIRNSWEQLGDRTVCIVNTTEKPMAYWEYHAGNRSHKYISGMEARMNSRMTAEAEFKALDMLKAKVTESQFRSYMLNGGFPEHSEKSDIFYFFRKGLPVMAVSYHGEDYKNSGHILACLCLHPYGYYRFTHAGVMCPTDEVIAQLLLMRADEHKFWAKSGQWRVSDPRSGI